MTDAELIARLRDAKRDWPEFGHDRAEAADRIEELAKERDEADDLAKAAFADGASNNIRLAETSYRVKWLEAKLAECEARLRKAVEALRGSRETILQLVNSRGSEAEGTDEDWVGDIDTTLAEIKLQSSEFATQKGESHD